MTVGPSGRHEEARGPNNQADERGYGGEQATCWATAESSRRGRGVEETACQLREGQDSASGKSQLVNLKHKQHIEANSMSFVQFGIEASFNLLLTTVAEYQGQIESAGERAQGFAMGTWYIRTAVRKGELSLPQLNVLIM